MLDTTSRQPHRITSEHHEVWNDPTRLLHDCGDWTSCKFGMTPHDYFTTVVTEHHASLEWPHTITSRLWWLNIMQVWNDPTRLLHDCGDRISCKFGMTQHDYFTTAVTEYHASLEWPGLIISRTVVHISERHHACFEWHITIISVYTKSYNYVIVSLVHRHTNLESILESICSCSFSVSPCSFNGCCVSHSCSANGCCVGQFLLNQWMLCQWVPAHSVDVVSAIPAHSVNAVSSCSFNGCCQPFLLNHDVSAIPTHSVDVVAVSSSCCFLCTMSQDYSSCLKCRMS